MNTYNHLNKSTMKVVLPVLNTRPDPEDTQTSRNYLNEHPSNDSFAKKLSEIEGALTAVKHDSGKLPLNLIPTEALNQIAAVLQFGATKYSANNWRKGFDWSRLIAAAMRHLTAFNAGEDKDPESGLSHLAHCACCLAFLLEFEKTHPELDDRYKQ